MEDQDQEKTEEPTGRRIDEAREKGQVPFSRELTSFLFFLALALNILFLAPDYSEKVLINFSKYITGFNDIIVDEKSIVQLFKDISKQFFLMMGFPILLFLFFAIFSSGIQNSIVISTEPLNPNFEKISLLSGIKRLFSVRSIVEFLKGLLKISCVGFVGYLVVKSHVDKIIFSPDLTFKFIVQTIVKIGFQVVAAAACVMLILSIFDLLYQRFEFLKNLRMTRQELKEEYKQTEGSPEIKAKLKRIRQERARKRMIAAVPKADVVIRNPTHYAIALEYKETKMQAPRVVAMGQDNLALKIIEVAEENDITIVTNKPLAKALFESAELDEEIPLEHYKAVAEVIGYVYRLKNKLNQRAA